MNIYVVLQEEHREMLALLQRAGRAPVGERGPLVRLLIDELSAHTIAEHAVLLQRISAERSARPVVSEARQECAAMARLMAALTSMRDDDDRFAPVVQLLTASLANHIVEEEREIFFHARRVVEPSLAAALPLAFLAAKDAAGWRPIEDRLAQTMAGFDVDDDAAEDDDDDDDGDGAAQDAALEAARLADERRPSG